MSKSTIDFDLVFKALTGFPPFPWQRRLYHRLLAGDWPEALDIPTGLGKTSVIPIWLLALASTPDSDAGIPRRLVYVVNRRTIVDQATDEARKMLTRLLVDPLAESDPPIDISDEERTVLDRLASILKTRAGDDEVFLSISTLRGQFADNGAWRHNPARPAIVVGTVDLIGSRLLFRGYRSSWKQRSFDTGLIGHDALIVHDEAHLAHPFQALLDGLTQRQGKQSGLRPLRRLGLSATAMTAASSHSLEDDDRQHRVVAERLHAVKQLWLAEAAKPVDAIIERACGYLNQPTKVLVYVRTPKDAATIAGQLAAAIRRSAGKAVGDTRVALLTGTLRGLERDRLLNDAGSAMRHFRAGAGPLPSDIDTAVYLVSTSAGEVGVDLDADHLVCDLVPADALVQRLGRVNRRGGEGRTARIHVYAEANLKTDGVYGLACEATAKHLRQLGASDDQPIDAGPNDTRGWVTESTRSPVPEVPPLTDAALDALALTSIAGDWPVVPDIGQLLHGLEDEPAQTSVIWRDEVSALAEAKVDTATLEEVYRTHRPLMHEQVNLPTHQVVAFLIERIRRMQKKAEESGDPAPAMRAVVVGNRAAWLDLDADTLAQSYTTLAYATLVLPAAFGGLHPATGTIDAKADAQEDGSLDVADESGDRQKKLREPVNGYLPSHPTGHRPVLTVTLDPILPREYVFYRKRQAAMQTSLGVQATVADHNAAAKVAAQRFAEALKLPASLSEPLIAAAAAHDLGKQRTVWQASIHNLGYPDTNRTAYAKSDPNSNKPMAWQLLKRYRHEFGSLIDVGAADDLTLHLIASHHGRARPHFPGGGFDPERGEAHYPDPAEIARRFDRLQRAHGHWGLAWLEAILRAADGWASRDTPESEDEL